MNGERISEEGIIAEITARGGAGTTNSDGVEAYDILLFKGIDAPGELFEGRRDRVANKLVPDPIQRAVAV